MKAIFLLDQVDEKGQVTAPNIRAVEIAGPEQFQLRQVGTAVVLCQPVDETHFIPLVHFNNIQLAPIPTAEPTPAPAEAPAPKKSSKSKKAN